jgi:hypothetical protein
MTLDLAAIGIPDRVLTAAECFDAGVRAAQAIDVNAYLRDGEHERIYELLWRTEHSVAWLVSWWEPRSYEIVDGVLTRTPGSPDEESPKTPGLDEALVI